MWIGLVHLGPPLWNDLEAFLGHPEILVSLCIFSGAVQFLLRRIFLSPALGFSTLAVGVCLEKGARRNSHHSGGRPSLNPPLFIQNFILTFHYSWSSRVRSLTGMLLQRIDYSSPEGVRERSNCPLCRLSTRTSFVCDGYGDGPPKSPLKGGLFSGAVSGQSSAVIPFMNCLSSRSCTSLVAHIQ